MAHYGSITYGTKPYGYIGSYIKEVSNDLRSLAPSSLIELFELNLPVGYKGDTIRFHNGLNFIGGNIVWNGNTYNYFPIEATGFEFSSKGQLPRPTMKVANVSGLIGTLVRDYNDLLGAKVTRIRTLAKYLDAVNFPNNINPTADPNAELPRDYYYIDRKSSENKMVIEFELAAKFDVSLVKLPRRQIVQNTCTWKYRGAECGYTGTNYFDVHDQSAPAQSDVCGKRLTSCQLRWGNNAELPYGGFPSVGLIR